MLILNWKLALAILGVVPFIGLTFRYVLRKVRSLFMQSQQSIDTLNRVINESILGAALIRILNAQQIEYDKFLAANAKARDLGLSILRIVSAALVPAITFAVNVAVVVILAVGGNFRHRRNDVIGRLHGFQYLSCRSHLPDHADRIHEQRDRDGRSILCDRLSATLNAPEEPKRTHPYSSLHGEVSMEKRHALTSAIRRPLRMYRSPQSLAPRTAIIGPTAAGKTQILHLLDRSVEDQRPGRSFTMAIHWKSSIPKRFIVRSDLYSKTARFLI